MPDAHLHLIAVPQGIPLPDLLARLLPGGLTPNLGLDLAMLLLVSLDGRGGQLATFSRQHALNPTMAPRWSGSFQR